jgi:hypothetical protein
MREPLDPSLSGLHHHAATAPPPFSLSLPSLHSNPPHHYARLGLSLAAPSPGSLLSALLRAPPFLKTLLNLTALAVRFRFFLALQSGCASVTRPGGCSRKAPRGWRARGRLRRRPGLHGSQEGLSGSLLLPILRICSCSRSGATALVPFGVPDLLGVVWPGGSVCLFRP